MRSATIRETFLRFFEKNDHTRVTSSSLIPAGDPTLFFTNAGMVQFKDVFTGLESRPYVRACSSQKCMRVSGKHNDLESVGMTPRHHTFFEMLGNFSFGDYFKKEAIAFAWEFLTKEMKLDPKHMIITVFQDDGDAEKLWKQHVAGNRIFRLGEKDNFWAMGDVGPCGPCSEILWDHGSGKITASDLNTDRVMEIWNLVFMQFERSRDGSLKKLGKPSIDTGMGLERLSAVMQGVSSNWETDLFMPIIERIEAKTKRSGAESVDVLTSLRVIADHIRGTTLLISDGVIPSNEGRGYVLRRIMRRAIRHGRKLGVHAPFFSEIADAVIDQMKAAYPDLLSHKAFIEQVIAAEEERFGETLDRGLEMLQRHFTQMKRQHKKIVDGATVFELYDTYGFPKDLTEIIAREERFAIDDVGFESLMESQRERARKSWKGSGEKKDSEAWKDIVSGLAPTTFVGYEKDTADSVVVRLAKEGKSVQEAKEGDAIAFVTEETPFYGEGGGQVGDSGVATSSRGTIRITDTQKPVTGIHIHYGIVERGNVSVGDRLTLAIDRERRSAIRKNHTATHLLHAALRKILGTHVKQSGSYLDDQSFRFDFSHFRALTQEQCRDVEALANEAIAKNIAVRTEVLSHKEAIAKGALAFFGEKYGERVRMVSVPGVSTELCGGTHVATTGNIGMVTITRERSVASGIRRIEALSGEVARAYACEEKKRVQDEEHQSKAKEQEKVRLQKERAAHIQQVAEQVMASHVQNIQKVKLVAAVVSVGDATELREIADSLSQRIGSGVVVIGAPIEGKAACVVMVTKDLTKRFSAGDIMRTLMAEIGGKGGGRADFAQGGGADVSRLDEVIKKVSSFLPS